MNQQSRNPRVLELQGDCSVQQAEAIKTYLLEGLEGATTVDLDLSGVEAGDVTFLQLMCALSRTCLEQGIDLQVNQPGSPAVHSLARDAGFTFSCEQCATQTCFFREVLLYDQDHHDC